MFWTFVIARKFLTSSHWFLWVGSPEVQWNNNCVPTNGKHFKGIDTVYIHTTIDLHPTNGTLSKAIEFSYRAPHSFLIVLPFHLACIVYRYGWCNETNERLEKKTINFLLNSMHNKFLAKNNLSNLFFNRMTNEFPFLEHKLTTHTATYSQYSLTSWWTFFNFVIEILLFNSLQFSIWVWVKI